MKQAGDGFGSSFKTVPVGSSVFLSCFTTRQPIYYITLAQLNWMYKKASSFLTSTSPLSTEAAYSGPVRSSPVLTRHHTTPPCPERVVNERTTQDPVRYYGPDGKDDKRMEGGGLMTARLGLLGTVVMEKRRTDVLPVDGRDIGLFHDYRPIGRAGRE